MFKEAIGTGETIVEAQEDACKQLGMESDVNDIQFEILQMPEKKKFGIFGGSPAKVKATVKLLPADTAVKYLKSILDAMGLNNITIESKETENGLEINLEGDDVGAVIGRRGETLDALQYLTGLVCNNDGNSYYRVTVNTGDYREKREKTLEVLGRKLAFKVIKTGRKTSLEPMNPYERRIIHTAVQKVTGAISWSEGENINRHVVIGIDPKAKPYRKDYNRNRGPRKNYNNNGFKKRTYDNDKPCDDVELNESSVERKPINEGGDFSLYGRIDKKD